jgi:hypothetical protein
MDDIEAVIEASKHFKYHDKQGVSPFNRISSLPESKRNLKRALKERIRLLYAAYISLASFIDDDFMDQLENSENIKAVSKIYKKVLRDMEKFRKELEDFDPLEVTNI